MDLTFETDEGCLSVLAEAEASSPAAEAWKAPALTSPDDLVAMCRDLGVGTGLLRACLRRIAPPSVEPDEIEAEPRRFAGAEQESSNAFREASGFWV